MEIKQVVCIQVKKGEDLFSFYIPAGASYGMCQDAAYDVLLQINKMSQDAVAKANPNPEVKE
jgi:hypothetical protein